MKKLKFVILSPRGNNGGIIVLHNLCRLLTEQGYNAKIFYTNSFQYRENKHFSFWLRFARFLFVDSILCVLKRLFGEKRIYWHPYCSVEGCKRKIFPFVDLNTVVVYPEIVYGNPLRAKKVVRWLLYYYGSEYPNANETWGENFKNDDLVFCYRKIFNDKRFNPTERILCTSYFDLDLYKQTNFGERNGKCYIIRKGFGRSDLPSSFDGIVIDDLPESEKVRVFNESEYCVSYDTQTAYSSIAALCGCISIVVPEEGKTRSDYLSSGEHSYGRAYGFNQDEINYAIETREKVYEQYKTMNNRSKEQVDYFIKECKQYFFSDGF